MDEIKYKVEFTSAELFAIRSAIKDRIENLPTVRGLFTTDYFKNEFSEDIKRLESSLKRIEKILNFK